MTREEALDKWVLPALQRTWNEKKVEEILKALEQEPDAIHNEREQAYMEGYEDASKRYRKEPCEDAISREDVLMALTGEWTESTDELIHRFIRRIRTLPPVTPHPKMGHWIRVEKHYEDDEQDYDYYEIHCSQCGILRRIGWMSAMFCPNCGAKMEESEE